MGKKKKPPGIFKLKRSKADPETGRTVVTESGKYYGWVTMGKGRRERVPLHADEAQALDMLREKQAKAGRAARGIADAYEDNRERPLDDQLKEFRKAKASANNTEGHVETTLQRAGDVIDGCRFNLPDDINADEIADYLAGRRKAGLSIASSNGYTTAVKAFSKWLTDNGRLRADPLRRLKRLNAAADLKHPRRALSPEDFDRLVEAARTSPRTLWGLDGPARAMLYTVASYTGFRAKALASLTVGSFDLDAGAVTVLPGYQKNRRAKTLPVHRDLIPLVRAYIEGKATADRLWPGQWAAGRHGAEMVRADLAAASAALREERKLPADAPDPIPYRDASKRCFDFHSTRGQFGTNLARAGVHPRRAQELLGHSDINLTMKFYTKLELADLHEAMGKLPGPTPPPAAPKTPSPEPRAPNRASETNTEGHGPPRKRTRRKGGDDAGK